VTDVENVRDIYFGYAILNFRKYTIDTKKKMRKEIGERGDDICSML